MSTFPYGTNVSFSIQKACGLCSHTPSLSWLKEMDCEASVEAKPLPHRHSCNSRTWWGCHGPPVTRSLCLSLSLSLSLVGSMLSSLFMLTCTPCIDDIIAIFRSLFKQKAYVRLQIVRCCQGTAQKQFVEAVDGSRHGGGTCSSCLSFVLEHFRTLYWFRALDGINTVKQAVSDQRRWGAWAVVRERNSRTYAASADCFLHGSSDES